MHREQYGEYAYWCQVVFSTWFSFMHFQKSHISKEGREFKRKIGDQSAWTQVGKWCALIEGALYFLCEGWLRDFIFMGIMIFNFFLDLFIIKTWSSWISCEHRRIMNIYHDAWKGLLFLCDWVLQKGLGDSPYWWSGRAG